MDDGALAEAATEHQPLPEFAQELPASGTCPGRKCVAGAARGEELGLVARNGLCWRCHYLDRRLEVQRVLRGLVRSSAEEQAGARAVLTQAPATAREVLAAHVRPAGVAGATAQHVATAMRRAGLTAVGPGGRICEPIPPSSWEKRCSCAVPSPHPEDEWVCTDCGAPWGHEEEIHPDSICAGCGTGDGELAWCLGCQAFWHAAPEGPCAGWNEHLRARGGLCPQHGARYAQLWWQRREEVADAEDTAPAALGPAAEEASQPYPGGEPGPAPPAPAAAAASAPHGEGGAAPRRSAVMRRKRKGGVFIFTAARQGRRAAAAAAAPPLAPPAAVGASPSSSSTGPGPPLLWRERAGPAAEPPPGSLPKATSHPPPRPQGGGPLEAPTLPGALPKRAATPPDPTRAAGPATAFPANDLQSEDEEALEAGLLGGPGALGRDPWLPPGAEAKRAPRKRPRRAEQDPEEREEAGTQPCKHTEGTPPHPTERHTPAPTAGTQPCKHTEGTPPHPTEGHTPAPTAGTQP